MTKQYSAFISYSHAADGAFAPSLQDGLQKLAKPWRQRRALEVFRDQTGLAVNPDLWASICDAMEGSEWFVLLCSPAAAQSEWVGKEIERWVQSRGSERILPIVTEGTFVWDAERGDIDFERSTAAHPSLAGVFAAEPRHLDMTWARSDTDLTLRNARFRDQVAEIAAPMHGTTKDELEGEDVRQQRHTRRLARGAATLLAVLTVLALGSAAVAVGNAREAAKQRDEARMQREEANRQRGAAETQARIATSQRLSDLSTTAGPDLQALLAAQAHRMARTPQATGAMVQALVTGSSGVVGRLAGHDGAVVSIAYAEDGSRIVTVDDTGAVRTFSASGAPVGSALSIDARDAAFASSDTVVAASRDGAIVLTVGDDAPAGTVDVGGPATRVATIPGSDAVVIGLESGGLATVSAAGEVLSRIDGVHEDPVWFVAASDDGEAVVSHSRTIAAVLGFQPQEGSVVVHDPGDLSVRSTWTGDEAVLALSPDGSTVAVAPSAVVAHPDGGTVLTRLLDASTGAEVGAISIFEPYSATDAAFVPTGDAIVVATTGGVDGAPGQAFLAPMDSVSPTAHLLSEPMTRADVTAVAPGGATAAIGGSDPSVPLLSLGGDAFGGDLSLGDGARPVVPLSVADEPGLVVVEVDGGLGVAALDGEVTRVPASGSQAVISPDGTRMLTEGGLISVPDGELVGEDDLPPPRFDLPPATSADGGRMAYVTSDGLDVAVVDLETGALVASGPAPAALCPVAACSPTDAGLVLSPDGSQLLIRFQNLVDSFDLERGWEQTGAAGDAGGGGLVFSDDGSEVLLQTGALIRTVDPVSMQGPLTGTSTNATGRWLRSGESLVAADRCSLALVDPVSFRTIAAIPVDVQPVEGGCLTERLDAAWASDGEHLLTMVDTCEAAACPVQRWDLDPDRLVDALCSRAGRNLTRAEWEQFVPGFDYEATCDQWPAADAAREVSDVTTTTTEAPSSTERIAEPEPTTTSAPTTSTTEVPPAQDGGPGTVCGQVSGSPESPEFDVVLKAGVVTCDEAMAVATTYFTDPTVAHSGSGGFATIDDFFCGFISGAGDEGGCTREDPFADFGFIRTSG